MRGTFQESRRCSHELSGSRSMRGFQSCNALSAALRFLALGVSVVPGFVVCGNTQGQCQGRWLATDGNGIDGPVQAAAAWDPDGGGPAPARLILGGTFANAGASAASNIASWDGHQWQALGAGLTGTVKSIVEFRGQVMAGGEFGASGAQSLGRIGAWDGVRWSPLGSGVANGTFGTDVSAMVVFEGDLIAGGNFTTAGGQSASYIARWNGTTWSPMGTGLNTWVRSLRVENGVLYAGGFFTPGHVARWTGETWQPIGAGMSGPSVPAVFALASYQQQLFAGGLFNLAGGTAASFVARWSGSQWESVGGGMQNWVNCLAVHGGELVAGGFFDHAGMVEAVGVARWNGTNWQSLGVGTNQEVLCLASFRDELIAGGRFTLAGGRSSLHWARWTCRCTADFDDGSGTGVPDGGVTIDDLLYYLSQFAEGSVVADLDDGSGSGLPDGGVTIDDLLYFLAHFAAGC